MNQSIPAFDETLPLNTVSDLGSDRLGTSADRERHGMKLPALCSQPAPCRLCRIPPDSDLTARSEAQCP